MNPKFLLIILGLSLALTACKAEPKFTVQNTKNWDLVKDVSYGNDKLMTYDVYFHEGQENVPVVFVVHGGSAKVGDKSNMTNQAKSFAREGYVTVNTNYRYDGPYGHSPHDLACSIASFRTQAESFGADPDKIILYGNSAGANLSGWLYFKQGFDWLDICPVKDPLPEFAGYIGKSGFHPGIPYPDGMEVSKTRGETVWQVSEEILADEEYVEMIESTGLTELTLGDWKKDGLINQIDSGDYGPVVLFYGGKDKYWESENKSMPFLLKERLENSGIPVLEFFIPEGTHGVTMEEDPEVKAGILEYVEAQFTN